MFTYTHKPSPALPLVWKCRSVPFVHGKLPATHSTLPVYDPPHVLKEEAFTLLTFSADARWVSSYAERGPSVVNRPLCLGEKCWRNVSRCLWKLLHLMWVCGVDSHAFWKFDIFLSSVSFYSHLWAAMDSFLLWRSIRENINLQDWHLIPSLGR